MKTYLGAEPWTTDTSLLPIPWRDFELPNPLRIAVMWSDDVVTPHPPIQRGLEAVVKALKQDKDIEVVDWAPFGHAEAWKVSAKLYLEDRGKRQKEILDSIGEPMVELKKFVHEGESIHSSSAEQLWDVSFPFIESLVAGYRFY